jgi:hypothetical protein
LGKTWEVDKRRIFLSLAALGLAAVLAAFPFATWIASAGGIPIDYLPHIGASVFNA